MLQPCGHLCLCVPCSQVVDEKSYCQHIFASNSKLYSPKSQALRNHFLAGRLRDLMFGVPIPRTPCPICRWLIAQLDLFIIAQSAEGQSRTASEFLPRLVFQESGLVLSKCLCFDLIWRLFLCSSWSGFPVLSVVDESINIKLDARIKRK